MPRTLVVGLLVLAAAFANADEAPQRPKKSARAPGMYRDQVEPHWFADNSRFWYRNDLRNGAKEFVLVDASAGKRTPAFDHKKLAASLSKAAGKEYSPDRLPFDRIEFADENKAVRFRANGKSWKCDLTSYDCSKADDAPLTPSPSPCLSAGRSGGCSHLGAGRSGGCSHFGGRGEQDGPSSLPLYPLWERGLGGEGSGPGGEGEEAPDPLSAVTAAVKQRKFGSTRSPDGKWSAVIRDSNVWVTDAAGKETQLSKDGKAASRYDNLTWSPDSKALVAFPVESGDRKEVHLVESSPRGGGRAKLSSRAYPLPGDRFTSYECRVFDPAAGKQFDPKVDRIDFGFPTLRWKKDGRHFTYQKVDRGHQRFRVVEVDSHTGEARNLIDERSKTFIWTAHAQFGGTQVRYLEKKDEMIYVSEMDGWRHLYLYDGKSGKLVNQITKGEWVVRGIDQIDEENRRIWFRASGVVAGQDPYLIHHYRVDFDGKNLIALTDADGTHSVRFSPDRKYLIARHERIDLPPVHELRRVEDGKLVVKLEEADVEELKKTGWAAPEVISAKGRDGKTDIWGVLYKPKGFDPRKRYPVIEYIYAGPHDSHVPKRFMPFRSHTALTDLGFVVVQIDGMGTANRSKAFHDVCWRNLKDAGFPDRIAWHKSVAKKYKWYDTSRVGIYGTSAGGQNALGALLFHGDFYKAAMAACGCHDNRMDKASWNEQWMGYPVGKHYSECSNVDNAHKLRGKLLLIVGEMDTNVPPESTMRVADALIKADKDFDLLVIPGMGHSDGGSYGRRRMNDFFMLHLQGKVPPDRNADRTRK